MVVYLPVSVTLKKKGAFRDDIPDVLQSTSSSISSSSVVQVGMLLYFLDQWGSITLPIGFFLIWLKATISSLGHSLHSSVILSISTLRLLLLIIL